MTIESLAPEIFAEFTDQMHAFIAEARSTEPLNRTEYAKLYRKITKMTTGHTVSKVKWFEGPQEAFNYLYSRRVPKNTVLDMIIPSSNYWTKYPDLLAQIPNIKADKEKCKLLDVANKLTLGGIYWVFDTEIVVVDRPSQLEVDEAGRLHNVNGPAISWRDGTAYYYVTGISIEKQYIKNPLSLTIEVIKETRNNDVRRALIMVYGIHRYIKDIRAKLIDSSSKEKLYRLPDNTNVMLCWDGSTNKVHEVVLPEDVNSVEEAQESISGLPWKSMLERS